MGNGRFLKNVKFRGEDNIRSDVFKEEQENSEDLVLIPNVVSLPKYCSFDNDQVILHSIVQDVDPVQGKNDVFPIQANIDHVILPDIV